jgi:hypothetical protein
MHMLSHTRHTPPQLRSLGGQQQDNPVLVSACVKSMMAGVYCEWLLTVGQQH